MWINTQSHSTNIPEQNIFVGLLHEYWEKLSRIEFDTARAC